MRNYDKAKSFYTVANVAALPLTGKDGEVYVVLDNGAGVSAIYLWDSNALVWISSGSSSSSWSTVHDDEVLVAAPLVSWTTGIDGDAAGLFRFTYHILGTAALYYVTFNNDVAANYIRHSDYGFNATPGSLNDLTASNMVLGVNESSGSFLIHAKAGKNRIMSGVHSYLEGGASALVSTTTYTWTDTVANLIRMDVIASTNNINAKSTLLLEEFTG